MANVHIKTAFDHIRRSPFQALSAIMVLSITFFVITILSIIVYSSEQAIKYFERRPQVITFIKTESVDEDIMALKSKLENDARVVDLKYISKEDALTIYKDVTSDNPLLSELVNPSIFPASLEFSLSDLARGDSLINELKSEAIVDSVGFTASLGDESELSNELEKLRKFTWYVRTGGGMFVFLLGSTSFLVLLIIIGMRMTARRDEIEILDLIGATPGFIRVPIIIEALAYAFFGVLTGWLMAAIAVLYTTPTIYEYFDQIPVLPRDTTQLLMLLSIILAVEFFIGMFLGLSGSLIAVSRAHKKR